MHDLTPISALVGGALIGLAASIFLLTHGRVAGISGLLGGLLRPGAEHIGTGLAFLAGLCSGGVLLERFVPDVFDSPFVPSWPIALLAGLIVGFGTQLGSGCTSGHGVCGVSRLSIRSLFATSTFMATGFATVFVMRHVFGGAQ
jgi:uncharacterized membrane protein YedE/YeeE